MRPQRWQRDSLAPCVAIGANAFARALAEGDHGAQTSLLAVCDRILAQGWVGLTFPAVLASIRLDSGDAAERVAAAPWSSMARALQRLHAPPLRWLLDGTADDRRQMVIQALRSPLRSVRALAQRALFGWRR